MSWLQRSYLLWTKSVQRASSLNNKGLTYTSILQVDRGRWGVHDGVALVAFGPLNRVWLDDAAQVNIALKLEMSFKHGSARIWKGASCLRSDGGGVPRWSAAFELTGRTKCQTIKGYLPESSRKNKVPNNQEETASLHHVPIKGKMSYKVISFWINFLLLYWIFILRSQKCLNDWYVFNKLEDMDLDLSRLLKRRDFKP